MIELKIDLWTVEPVDAVVITTNGFVKRNGACVMGRGCAKEAARMWPDLPADLGTAIKEKGNECFVFEVVPDDDRAGFALITMPVKHNWWEAADPSLIAKSVEELKEIVDKNGYEIVAMPRPGCGSGKLKWRDVKPILEPFLDDRFIVCDYA
jgi:O-acetyl-ADP-ribose deacetylase (regulator of RNase III)